MDEFQKYKIKGLSDFSDAEELLETLADAGFYQCDIDFPSSLLVIPIVYANYIDDIEQIIGEVGFEFLDE